MLSCHYSLVMEDKRYPSHTLDKFQLRFPDGMRDRIKQAAEESGRSMNAEIIHRLEQSFESSGVPMDELPTPEQAREQAEKARASLQVQFRSFIRRELRSAIERGLDSADIDLHGFFDVESMEDAPADKLITEVIDPVINELRQAGYDPKVHDYSLVIVDF